MAKSGANAPIEVDGVENFRSTAGYPARGGCVRTGRLFRSGSLQDITPTGQQVISGLGIRTLIDLRTDAERSGWPNRVWPGVRVAACPILDDAQEDPQDDSQDDAEDATLHEIYWSIISERGPQIAAAVRTISDAGDSGVVVNCYAGKDRTGIVIAIALLAAGVDQDVVIADYAASWRDPAEQGEATVRMARMLEDLGRSYGDATGLLRRSGFTGDDLERLRRTLIVE